MWCISLPSYKPYIVAERKHSDVLLDLVEVVVVYVLSVMGSKCIGSVWMKN